MKRLALPSALFSLVVLLLGPLGAVGVASAQVYRWTDAQGDIHYSQGIDSVPTAHRATAVLIAYDTPPGSPQPEAAAARSGTGRITFAPGQPIMVTAHINGGTSAQLMLDTGATRTLVNPAVLAASGVSYRDAQRGSLRGVTGETDVLAVRVESLEVGGLSYGPLMVVSHDTGFGPERGDGLLGRDFLDHFTVIIDNTAGVVTLTPK